MRLTDITTWLDEYLRVRDVPDDPQAFNGLQVENAGTVTRIAAAVDACRYVFERAAELRADLLLVHHGLFWGGITPLTGRHFANVATLVQHGTALYGAHIPLDIHPEVGNNALLASQLGMAVAGWWGEYHGTAIGVHGVLDERREVLNSRIGTLLNVTPRLLACGPQRVRRVGIVTGAGGSMIAEARDAGLDTLITGEGKHHSYFDAEELGVNVIYAGHYATETVGVKALAELAAQRFGLPWSFIDHPTGL